VPKTKITDDRLKGAILEGQGLDIGDREREVGVQR
jgi:hypothetical protein